MSGTRLIQAGRLELIADEAPIGPQYDKTYVSYHNSNPVMPNNFQTWYTYSPNPPTTILAGASLSGYFPTNTTPFSTKRLVPTNKQPTGANPDPIIDFSLGAYRASAAAGTYIATLTVTVNVPALLGGTDHIRCSLSGNTTAVSDSKFALEGAVQFHLTLIETSDGTLPLVFTPTITNSSVSNITLLQSNLNVARV